MHSLPTTFVQNVISPLFGVATLFIGLAGTTLFSDIVPRQQESKMPLTEIKHEEVLDPATRGKIEEIRVVGGPKVTQSQIVRFPHRGAIKVESVEEVGQFPKIIFSDIKNRAVLFRSAITDSDGWLKPTMDEFTQPFLRFREVRSADFPSPLIMAVAVRPGGSDNGFYLAVFGEINGMITRLTEKPIDTAIQGGYYLGFLNRKLGYGLVSWCFDWDFDASERHYDEHHYSMTVYSLRRGKFRKKLSYFSKRRYDPDHSSKPLRELGITANDQRRTIAGVAEFLD
jgi:hypothetical protein